MRTTAQDTLLQGVIYSVFQRPALASSDGGFVAAIVAAHDGAGTSTMTALLADSLVRDGGEIPAVLDCRELVKLHGDSYDDEISTADRTALGKRDRQGQADDKSWRSCREYRARYIAQAREHFGNVLVDCPSLKSSTDVLGIASLVDGVFLVVEANRTTKNQVAYLERTVQAAGGHILGHLLNKRTYPIPEWVHSKMMRLGL